MNIQYLGIEMAKINWVRITLVSTLFLIFSCEKSVNSDLEAAEKTLYYFKKIDSIRIDKTNSVRILDFNPENGHFLSFDPIRNEFLILNRKGQLLKSVSRFGEGPNEYNSSLIAASFNKEGGGYFAQSSTEFLWYDEDWKIRDRIKFASEKSITSYGGPKTRSPYFRLSDDDLPFFFTSFFSSVNTSTGSEEDEVFSEYLIELYDPKIKRLNWAFKNEPQILPNYDLDDEGKKIYPVQIFYIDREENVLYLTFDQSNEIGVYDLENDFKLLEKIRIHHQNFFMTQNSRNKSVFKINSQLVGLLYFEGLSEAATDLRKVKDPDYFAFQDPAVYKFIILKDGVQYQEIDFPKTSEPHSEIILMQDNRLLLKDNYLGDSEPNYSTYSVFELRQKH